MFMFAKFQTILHYDSNQNIRYSSHNFFSLPQVQLIDLLASAIAAQIKGVGEI